MQPTCISSPRHQAQTGVWKLYSEFTILVCRWIAPRSDYENNHIYVMLWSDVYRKPFLLLPDEECYWINLCTRDKPTFELVWLVSCIFYTQTHRHTSGIIRIRMESYLFACGKRDVCECRNAPGQGTLTSMSRTKKDKMQSVDKNQKTLLFSACWAKIVVSWRGEWQVLILAF